MKTFDIAELDTFHLSLIRFLESRYGSAVSGTVVLMAIESSQWLSEHDLSKEERHMNLVDKIRGIAKAVNRPQRVPTMKEWSGFVIDVRDGAWKFSNGDPLVANPENPKFADAIVAHEAAAKASRIFGTVSRAAAR
ncbi:hypothetical protein HFO69_32305 [Rhizobium laguerreae]|uniref:hypothetical protein n=1 Tax=Rhizobium TaxID=379 RepID=UPI0004184B62|nr:MULTISPECIES: hypothetical protein [Rhizobium]MBY3102327.1 hypothetical protein [Rhizobium laguerreae]